MSKLKKLILSLALSSFLLTTLFVPYARAQTWYLQEYRDWYLRVYDTQNQDEIFGERYTAAQVEWVIYGLFAFIFNHVLTDQAVIACLIENRDNPALCAPQIEAAIRNYIGGLIGYGNSPNEAVADKGTYLRKIIFERELSGLGYLRRAASKFKLAPEVKAQGFGFEAAGSVRLLWSRVRDVTYFLLVIVIVIMAFMIMFRVKLSPQTVITVQTALPRVIITLILITFSYAIAGFMIDLMYVVIGLIASIFQQSDLFSLNWNDMFNALSGTGVVNGLIPVFFIYFITFAAISFLALISNITGFINLFTGGTEIIWILIVVIALIVLLILLIRILWTLVRTFVIVLLLIVASPILILMGLLGGGGFGTWLRNLASHLAVFVAVGVMLALSFLFLYSALPGWWPQIDTPVPIGFGAQLNVLDDSPWVPPFLMFTGAGDMDLVWLFASLVILTLIPRISDIIRGLITGRPFPLGTAIGEAFGPAIGLAGFGAAGAIGYGGERFAKRFPARSWGRGTTEQITGALQKWAASGFRR